MSESNMVLAIKFPARSPGIVRRNYHLNVASLGGVAQQAGRKLVIPGFVVFALLLGLHSKVYA